MFGSRSKEKSILYRSPIKPDIAPSLEGKLDWDIDWAWRPNIFCDDVASELKFASKFWIECGPNIVITHDDRNRMPEISINPSDKGNGCDLSIACGEFSGTFLSIAIELPRSVVKNLTTGHMFQFDVQLDWARYTTVYGRLNIKHGPNTESIVQQISERGLRSLRYDLGFSNINEKRLEKAWLDISFDNISENVFVLQDIVGFRRPLARL